MVLKYVLTKVLFQRTKNNNMKILKYDLEGNYLDTHEVTNLKEVSTLLNLNYTSFIDHLKKRNISCSGFQFIEKESDRILQNIGDVSYIVRGMAEKPITKKYKGRFICSYKSIKDACDKNNLKSGSIQHSIKTGADINGLTFFYAS